MDELSRMGLDACTLNNALNIAQLVVLVALLKWVRRVPPEQPGAVPPSITQAAPGRRVD